MTIKDEMSMNEQKQVMPIDREAVIRELTQHIARADYIETVWMDCVSVPMLRGALELLKEQEPRVLTLEETLHRLKEPVFLETKSRQSYTGWVLVYDVQNGMGITGVRMGLTQPGHITTWYPIDLYGSKWRCWSAKPTDEQREATPWTE